MNNDRRKAIKSVKTKLEKLSAAMDEAEFDNEAGNNVLEECVNSLEEVKSEEEDAFGNLSEGLQSSRQESHDEIIEALTDAIDHIESLDFDDDDDEDIKSAIKECISKLEEIN